MRRDGPAGASRRCLSPKIERPVVGDLGPGCEHEPFRVSVRSRVAAGRLSTTSMPASARTASNAAVNCPARSRTRNRKPTARDQSDPPDILADVRRKPCPFVIGATTVSFTGSPVLHHEPAPNLGRRPGSSPSSSAARRAGEVLDGGVWSVRWPTMIALAVTAASLFPGWVVRCRPPSCRCGGSCVRSIDAARLRARRGGHTASSSSSPSSTRSCRWCRARRR